MTYTDRLRINKEDWSTASDVWGKRFTGNFHYIDALAGGLQNARRWEAGAVFNSGDVILDPETNLLFSAISSITVPSSTSLVSYFSSTNGATLQAYDSDNSVLTIQTGGSRTLILSPDYTYRVRDILHGYYSVYAATFRDNDLNVLSERNFMTTREYNSTPSDASSVGSFGHGMGEIWINPTNETASGVAKVQVHYRGLYVNDLITPGDYEGVSEFYHGAPSAIIKDCQLRHFAPSAYTAVIHIHRMPKS